MFEVMEGSMKGNGNIIRWKEKGLLLGLMVGNIREDISVIRNRVLECLSGEMERSMKENGLEGSSMERGFSGVGMECRLKENGVLARD